MGGGVVLADMLGNLSLLNEEMVKYLNDNKRLCYFPENGQYRRALYPKHMEFFAQGKEHRERCAMCANRVGKTESMGAFEVSYHLTGRYPSWWPGRRFDRPTRWWVAGEKKTMTRDIQQRKLMGATGEIGTGMIPKAAILKTTPMPNVRDAFETVQVRHWDSLGNADGMSLVTFKSYQEGREGFQGDEIDGVWLDEEPSMEVYSEALTRTLTTDGMVILTFTPLAGVTDVVRSFLPEGSGWWSGV